MAAAFIGTLPSGEPMTSDRPILRLYTCSASAATPWYGNLDSTAFETATVETSSQVYYLSEVRYACDYAVGNSTSVVQYRWLPATSEGTRVQDNAQAAGQVEQARRQAEAELQAQQDQVARQGIIFYNQYFPVQQDAPLTPQQVAEAERLEQARAEQRRLEEQRAEQLLLETLNDAQRLMYQQAKKFLVWGGSSGLLYEIRAGRSTNIWVYDSLEQQRLEKPLYRLCAHPRDDVPDQDTMAAQKLWLEALEPEFLKVAVCHAARQTA